MSGEFPTTVALTRELTAPREARYPATGIAVFPE